MDFKARSSFDDAGSVSALRRFTRSPTHRLSLRRLTPSSSSSAASVSSIDSSEAHPLSCVSRDTSRDECALHRFIVWAAVKRNASPKITAPEKLECPLLRCRQRFASHELMLQHLYACDRLYEGEYWCYDCAKVERLHDEKCRRCMGHPSKRRKIMSMAKNLFSSLGHKSKDGGIEEFDDMDSVRTSFDYGHDPKEAELQSDEIEIHEIGSSDVALPTIIETAEPEPEPPGRARRPPSHRRPVPTASAQFHAAELESQSSDALLNWDAYQSVQTVAPEDLMNQNESPNRPVLQLHTHGLEQYLQQARRRSKMLAPSSSVRSTSSTTSTNSTSSAASYGISPMSTWSGAWARAPGFDSTLTSPADDLMSPGGLLPTNNSFVDLCKYPGDCGGGGMGDDVADSFLSELPADIPMLDAMPMPGALSGMLRMDQSTLSFDPAMAADLSIESNLALTDDSHITTDMATIVDEPTGRGLVTAHTLVGSVRDTLEMHIAESMTKVQHVSKNHLVTQFKNMSPAAVAQAGLNTLTEVLEGQQATSPVNLLCFVHVVYSFSLVVHEQDAPSRWADLFSQAMSYSSWFSRQDLKAYTHIVASLWKPSGMSEDEVKSLLRGKASKSTSVLGKQEGKQRETVAGAEADSLVFVAQYFLDELEYQALQETKRPEIQASDLSVQHLKDVNLEAHKDSPFALAVNFLLKILAQQYGENPGFTGSMQHLSSQVNSSHVSTARRVELELMHAGRMCLPPNIYYDEYIVQVRRHIDSLYSQNSAHFNSRPTYYRHGVQLIQDIMRMSDGSRPAEVGLGIQEPAASGPSIDSIDEFIKTMTPDMDNFDFGTVPGFNTDGSMDPPIPIPDITVDPTSLDPTHWLLTPEATCSLGGPSGAATTSPSPAPHDPSASKTEANSSCEICGYRPKGDPRWFGGSMAKHKKLQHATSPPKIYRCAYPGCKSQYRNRPDNLRQHQLEKGHFVEGEAESSRRANKKRRVE